jgi:hypothetical protein
MALALGGCATATPRVSVIGRPVEVRLQATKDVRGAPLKGELLAVGPEKVWVMGPHRVSTLPLREVEEVRIRRHGLNGSRAWRWAVLGAVVSGTVLALACSSVEENDSCGRVFIPVLLTWGAIGVPSVMALSESSQLRVKSPNWETLRRYARFPQGLPEGLDPEALAPAPRTPKP